MGQSKSTSKNQGKWEYQLISQNLPSSTSEWLPFNSLDNFLIEKAYFRKQKIVDLDDSTIHFKNMIQILKSKDNTEKPRLIRRIKEKPHSAEGLKENQFKQRRQRFIGFENPKTINSALTSLPDLLLFFENRGPEIKKFANLFRECEVLPTLERFNKEIVPLLIESIQKEANKFPDKSNVQSIVELFEEKKFMSFKQFYGKVLMAYSLNEFLWRNINHYLRNENWAQLNDLLPFAFCLWKTFLYAEFLSNNPQKSFIDYNDENYEGEETTMILYRGAELDENLLALFNPKKLKYFSWQAFTSTTTDPQIGNNFLYENPNMRKIPTKFIIEASMGHSYFDENPNFIDISNFSVHPEENEVLIAPGSVFELKSCYRDSKGAEIRLELIKDPARLPYQGQSLSETIETELKKGITSKIVCLEGKELIEAIDNLRNNNLIEELEFCFCKFDDEKVLNHIIQALQTIKSIQKLAFFSIFPSEKKHYNIIFKDLFQLNIQSLHISERSLDDSSLSSLSKGLKMWASSLQNLNLDFEFCYFLTNKGLSNLCSQGLKYLTSLDSLSLNIGLCSQITDEGFSLLALHGLRYLNSLTTLTLSLPSCHITTKGLINLCSQGLQKLVNLKALNLNLKRCQLITDEGIQILCSEGIGKLISLISLNLNFESCKYLTDNSLNILSLQGLSHLTCLTSLTLSFQTCKKISDNGLFHLFSHGIKSISSLKSVEINLRGCLLISDKGLDIICSQGILNLKTLTLNFGSKNKISDEGFEQFKTKIHEANKNVSLFLSNSVYHDENEEKIKNFTFKRILKNNVTKNGSMKNLCPNSSFLNSSFLNSSFVNNENPENILTVYFTEQLEEELYLADSTFYFETFNFNASGNKFTDDQLTTLATKGLPKLASLSNLNLNFGSCNNISSKGFSNLSQAIGQFTSLSALSLSFESIPQIDDEDLNQLSFFGIQKLVFLNTLRLNFASCKLITDKGIERLCTKGIRKLNVLSSLSLNFGSCAQITDVCITTLSFQAIQYLTNLTTLDLNFESCNKITDKGLVNLSSSGIKNLEHLESLSLNFRFCTQITDGGLSKLFSSGIKYLNSLSTLNLDFGYCKNITDKGLSNIGSQGIIHLESLVILNLNFRSCDNITDQGVNCLCLQTIKHLNFLTTLNLHFEFCHRISKAGFRDLKKVFKYFGYKLDKF